MGDRWEYKIVWINADRRTGICLPSDLNQKFDEYGAEGWELASTESISRATYFPWGGAKSVSLIAFFKRRLGR
jgi:hypothetical protein